VGPLERAYYPEAGLRKFEGMAGSSLDIAYSSPQVVIYRVRENSRDSATGSP